MHYKKPSFSSTHLIVKYTSHINSLYLLAKTNQPIFLVISKNFKLWSPAAFCQNSYSAGLYYNLLPQ